MSLTSKARNERIASNRFIILLALLLLVSITLTLLSYSHVERWFAYNARYMEEVNNQQVLAQQLAKYSLLVRQGEKTSFIALRKVRNDSYGSLSILKDGINEEGLPPSPTVVEDTLRQVEQEWMSLYRLVDKILSNDSAIKKIQESTVIVINQLPKLTELTREVLQILMSKKTSQDQVFIASNQILLLQRVENNLRRILTGGKETNVSAREFGEDVNHFGSVLADMLNGTDNSKMNVEKITYPDAKRKLEMLMVDFKPVADAASVLTSLVPNAMPALDAIDAVSQVSDKVGEHLERLYNAYRLIPGRLSFLGMAVSQVTVILFGGLSAVFLILLGVQILTDARRREVESKALNETNQKAILRLLDEMGDLAEGDLTVQATVTEDITGAIADSINYAIDALRRLVTTINQTSSEISDASQETHNTAMHLAEASEHQAQQISQATSAIKDVSKAIDGMAIDAKDSAEVASRAVGIANKGAGIVRNTILGMNANREQIQETSKRIKRLGENAQEIGEIVELIVYGIQ